jgi:archaellum biogenesis ATPase FlaH
LPPERRIVAACLKSREAYNRIEPFVDRDKLTAYASYHLDLAEQFYARDKAATSVDKDFIVEKNNAHFDNPKKAAIYNDWIAECFAIDVSALNLAELIRESKEKQKAEELVQLLASPAGDKAQLLDAVDSYRDVLANGARAEEGVDYEVLNNVSVREINARVLSKEGRIKLLSAEITKALNGGLLKGHTVWVFARPEVGKSAFVLSCAASLVKQGLRVAFFENEDPIRATIERFQGCLTRMTAVDRVRDPDAAQQVLEAQKYELIDFVQITPGTLEEIDAYCEKNKPDVVIVNQLRNIKVRSENRTNQLEIIAVGLRNIAKKHNVLMIGVTQAGDSGTDKLVLDIGDIDSSNTGIPAAADVIIGIGCNKDFERDKLRMIAFPKNKTGGGHVYVKMKFNDQTHRYEDI